MFKVGGNVVTEVTTLINNKIFLAFVTALPPFAS